ncbi:hypothetical protein PLIP_a2801 [Pseudoalteromonas lipolytica LMEB 39]|nr:hypothetical protein [Pseudoalteromonas lipolytica LMEB 39]
MRFPLRNWVPQRIAMGLLKYATQVYVLEPKMLGREIF